jgi:hypothetical protein
MKRALVLAEGPTEERFIKDVLREHFWAIDLDVAPTVVSTKRVRTGTAFRGGITSFGKFENDARRLLGTAGSALVTTMIDYYRLPADFPGMATRPVAKAIDRVKHVEGSIRSHFGNPQYFFPYLSVHEFEALLFCSPDELARALTQPEAAHRFAAERNGYATPEEINERPGFSPAERIRAISPSFQKTLHGPSVTKRVGLERLRADCPHFNQWITELETFARQQ